MRYRWALIFLLLVALILLGCQGKGTLIPDTEPKPEIVKGSGVIVFNDFEGGCWTIKSDNGTPYEPIGLADSFKKDGLRVEFTLKTRPDMASICMAGLPADVVELTPVAGP
jgi:hypothetical protein